MVRGDVSFPGNYVIIAYLIVSNQLNVKNRPVEIYDVGVGQGEGICALSKELNKYSIEHYAYAVDEDFFTLRDLNKKFRKASESQLELFLGNAARERLTPKADIIIGLNISYNKGRPSSFSHIVFDNLVQAAKKGGYIISDFVKGVDEEAYGLTKIEMFHIERSPFEIYQKTKEKRVFGFPIPEVTPIKTILAGS